MPLSMSKSTPKRALTVLKTSPQLVIQLELLEDKVKVNTITTKP
jgi:hypothetical protein